MDQHVVWYGSWVSWLRSSHVGELVKWIDLLTASAVGSSFCLLSACEAGIQQTKVMPMLKIFKRKIGVLQLKMQSFLVNQTFQVIARIKRSEENREKGWRLRSQISQRSLSEDGDARSMPAGKPSFFFSPSKAPLNSSSSA